MVLLGLPLERVKRGVQVSGVSFGVRDRRRRARGGRFFPGSRDGCLDRELSRFFRSLCLPAELIEAEHALFRHALPIARRLGILLLDEAERVVVEDARLEVVDFGALLALALGESEPVDLPVSPLEEAALVEKPASETLESGGFVLGREEVFE